MKRLMILVAALVAIPLLLVLILAVVLSNPETYRDRLAATVQSSTGFAMELDGLSWRYWPPIALELEGVSLTNPETADKVINIENAAIDLELLPLLTGSNELAINGLAINGMDINAIIAENGSPNWEVSLEKPTGDPAAPSASSDDSNTDESELSVAIGGIDLENVTINYEDRGAKAHYKMSISELTTSAINPGAPMQLDMTADIEDVIGEIQSSSEISGGLQISEDMNTLKFQSLVLNNQVDMSGFSQMPVTLTLTGQADLSADTAGFDQFDISLHGFALQITMNVSQMTAEQPDISGSFNTNTFNPNQLMDQIGLGATPVTDPAALTKLQMKGDMKGGLTTMQLSALDGTMDASKVSGRATIVLQDPMRVNFDISLDQIIADGYLPPDETPPSSTNAEPSGGSSSPAANTTTVADSELIPVELLKEYDLDGQLRIGKMSYDTYQFDDFLMTIVNGSDQLKMDIELTGYEGSINVDVHSNYATTPQTTTKLNVKEINITALTGFEWITGHITMDSDIGLQGAMMGAAMDSINGGSNFAIIDGTLDVSSIKQLATTIDAIRGKQSSISQWPDKMPFKQLNGQHQFQGSQASQVFNFALENMKVAGDGGFNYLQNTMDYDINVNLSRSEDGAFQVGPALANIDWPLNCSGALDQSPVELCFPDGGSVQSLVADVVKQEVKRKGAKELNKLIEEKAPEQLKGLLKGLFDND